MKRVMIVLVFAVLISGVFGSEAADGAKPAELVAGGYEVMVGTWRPGQGNIEPGGKIRNWSAVYEATLFGPAGEIASGIGPVTMNCNLDSGLTGPCWGTFEYTNSTGIWIGTWQGSFNFATGAGSYQAVAHGEGGLRGLVLKSDVVYPGYAAVESGKGYIYSTVR